MSTRGEEPRCLEENTLLDFIAGRLDPRQLDAVACHADSCASCAEMIDELVKARSSAPGARGPLVAGEPWPNGTLVGEKYRVERRLGAGGMGTVYEAVNTWTRRRVAIKRLHAMLADDEQLAQRFFQEAQAATRIAHPHVVQVLDVSRDQDRTLYMVQEFLDGETLRRRLDRQQRLSSDEALAIIAPVIDALTAAHDAGVLHRDVKPENILLTVESGGTVVPKLIDFGLSKILMPEFALTQSDAGHAVGTPSYMAPEQLRAAGPLDARVDVWSVGVVLFEMLTGERPFRGASFGAVVANILDGTRPRLRDLAPDVPRHLADAVERALAESERRFASMRELRAAVGGPPRRGARRIWLAGAAVLTATLVAVFGVRWWHAPPPARSALVEPLQPAPAPFAKVEVTATAPPTQPAPPAAVEPSAPHKRLRSRRAVAAETLKVATPPPRPEPPPVAAPQKGANRAPILNP